jgi:hypothetical protein
MQAATIHRVSPFLACSKAVAVLITAPVIVALGAHVHTENPGILVAQFHHDGHNVRKKLDMGAAISDGIPDDYHEVVPLRQLQVAVAQKDGLLRIVGSLDYEMEVQLWVLGKCALRLAHGAVRMARHLLLR